MQLRRTVTRQGRRSVEVVYLICSQVITVAPPSQVAAWIRGHWAIEDRLHYVRDVTFDEDRCRVRTGSGAEVMATPAQPGDQPAPPRRTEQHRQSHQTHQP